MKKNLIICSTMVSILALSALPLFQDNMKRNNVVNMASTGNITKVYPINKVDPTSISNSVGKDSSSLIAKTEEKNSDNNQSVKQNIANKNGNNKSNVKEVKIVKKASVSSTAVNKNTSSNSSVRLSRGGNFPKNISKSNAGKVTVSTSSSKSTYSSRVEVLDWKFARNVFSINSIAEVTDVYSKKTFKVKRTMGTNHADTEALTREDTEIIKSIWGGFSWERRPVILNINGRKIAASMSAMPHAGIDAAPAFKVINNRSEGYGRGQNLDVVKGNGMDGHFDIHFLNSTRHKDGKKDPQHQAAILRAAE
ncbi:hypothetical protein GOM49_12475 [Clostridium bovifaecis]|uniref:Uncharacterized protein n=1 Tax=Clostridium bovifaecis TaxID=2184719 RepID=A0A6I6EU10_9CLOT|nr:hypothetical protein GOM49_12475 [Clostridium bovifaecis]